MNKETENKEKQKSSFDKLVNINSLSEDINQSMKEFRKMRDAFEIVYRNVRQKRDFSMSQKQQENLEAAANKTATEATPNISSDKQTATSEVVLNAPINNTAENIQQVNKPAYTPNNNATYQNNNYNRGGYQNNYNRTNNYQGNSQPTNGTDSRPQYQNNYSRPQYQNNNYNRPNYNSNVNNAQTGTTTGTQTYTRNYGQNGYQNNYNRPNYNNSNYTPRPNNYANSNPNAPHYNNVAFNNNRVNRPMGTGTGYNPNYNRNKTDTPEPLPDFIKNAAINQKSYDSKKKYVNKSDEKRVLNKRQQMKFGLLTEGDSEERMGSRKLKVRKIKEEHIIVPVEITNVIISTDKFTVKDLSEKMSKPAAELIKKFMQLGMMLTINSQIGFEEAELVASEFGITLERKVEQTAEEKLQENQDVVDDAKNSVKRPPVITVMGHVDHGKTSLLDAIRKTNVISGEAGGITQHIGAYTVNYHNESLTFIDTPGHAAFSAMRLRGAKVTDIAILVVAADDGVMPQTIEAIKYIKEAKVPMIVAINKIDKPEANIDRIKQQLTEHDVVPEEWGGDAYIALISAKTGDGLDKLMDLILLISELAEFKCNPNREASGNVLEANLDKNKGVIANLLVQNGTLKVGDNIVCGTSFGKIKSIINDKGQQIKEAGASTPISIMGLNETPSAGDYFYVINGSLSRQLITERKNKIKQDRITTANVSLDDFLARVDESKLKSIKLIIKSDVQGSSEALKESLIELSNDEVKVSVIYAQAGQITESDVNLAKASNAEIIAFDVKVGAKIATFAKKNNVNIKQYKIIYEAVDYITAQIKALKEPVYQVVELGKALVVTVFKLSSQGTVAGSRVSSGKILRNAKVRIMRNGEKIAENISIDSLKIQKEDQKEVAENYECGIRLNSFNDFKEGDIIECYKLEEVIEK